MLTKALCTTLGLLLSASLAWAGSTAVTGELVYPSQNDLYGSGVGGSAGDGKKLLETQWRKIAGPLNGQNNYTLTGGTLPATDPDLTMPVAAGTAVLEGHFVQWPATNVTLPASNTSHLFVKLVYGGGLVTGLEIEDNTSDSPPASSTKLGTATTSGSAVTATTDARILGPGAQVVLTSGTSYPVPAGIYRLKVRVFGASGGGGGGGEGGDGSGSPDGAAGTNGGNSGSTTFGALTANGGGGGVAGQGGLAAKAAPGVSGKSGTPGTASGGKVNLTGRGPAGGPGGTGGNDGGGTAGPGGNGGDGAQGGYAEDWIAVTPGSTITYSIGAAGTAGTAGSGASNGGVGEAGLVGQAGRIVLDF